MKLLLMPKVFDAGGDGSSHTGLNITCKFHFLVQYIWLLVLLVNLPKQYQAPYYVIQQPDTNLQLFSYLMTTVFQHNLFNLHYVNLGHRPATVHGVILWIHIVLLWKVWQGPKIIFLINVICNILYKTPMYLIHIIRQNLIWVKNKRHWWNKYVV